jgi:hypothetical protein
VDDSGKVFVSGNGTVAYSNAGVLLWTNIFSAGAIALDSSGNVFVSQPEATVAYSNAGMPLWTNYHLLNTSGAPVKTAVNSSGNVFVAGENFTTIAYSNSGVPLWTNRYNGGGNGGGGATAMAVDLSGNVFVTGGWSGHYATLKYSSAGVPLWTNRYNNAQWTPTDLATAVVVDGHGNVFVTGESCAPTGGGCPDYVTIKYSNAGVPLWTNRYDGPGERSDFARAIAVDSSGNVFVAGGVESDVPGVDDYATIAYSNDGEPLWANYYNDADSFSWAKAIAVDSLGNVFVTGDSRTSDGSYHITTIKYSSSVSPPVHLDFQPLNNQLVLSWTNAGFNLQTAPALTGPFSNLPGATSPYTNVTTGAQQFFRLISN